LPFEKAAVVEESMVRSPFLRRVSSSFLGLAFVLGFAGVSWAQKTAPAHRLTIEQLLKIKHPSDPIWSPDGRRVAFIWDDGGSYNLYVIDAAGHGQPIALTSYVEGAVGGVFWSHDGSRLYFPHQGDLWGVAASGGQPQAVWTTPSPEFGIVPSPDGTRVAFVRPGASGGAASGVQGSDLWVRSLADGSETHVAHDEAGIGGIAWSPDGAHIAYSGGSRVIHHDQTPSYSGAKLRFVITERTPGQLYVVAATGGTPLKMDVPKGAGGMRWIDGTHLVCDAESSDYKTRTIYVADASTGAARSVHQDVEDKFWSIPYNAGAAAQPSPNGRWIAYLSDIDGWDHLYVMPATGGEPVEVSKGHFESWRPQWSHDSTRIAFDANSPGHPGDRQLGIATIGDDPAHATITYVTSGRGTNVSPFWSPDDSRLVFQHTDPWNSADLFVVRAGAGAGEKPARLTESMPSDIDRSLFVAPQLVHYPGADGQMVPAWLFVPKNLDRTKKHPAIVWIHGDGINQNYDGWHIERHYATYYTFHQYLLQQGYIVIAPDYRGSIGYGRAWREGVYMDIGGKDAEDAWKAANYLKTLPYVDANHMGVWGLSYGGFFTLVTMTKQPTLYRAGIDVAGVVDFHMWYEDPYHSGWLISRIGTPEQYPQVYARTAPINQIDRLARPLLILHGTADINVPFIETVNLLDQVFRKKKGNLVDFMMYPGEFHYFDRTPVLRDAWRREANFFDTYVRGSKPTVY
jgi:dipeptidyl aminopeptidase/acylaminoacyl peptidase